MKKALTVVLPTLALSLLFAGPARAWGRHDLITQLSVDSPEFADLKKLSVTPEPIEKATPDLLKRVIPTLERWCERFHSEHDTRYSWTSPLEEALSHRIQSTGRKLSDREALLWALEDNIDTPLTTGNETNAAQILVRYVNEPDGPLDGNLDQPPYLERVRSSMSLFYEANNPHTHTFRHYYVPSSLIPPIFTPKGVAPSRAGLYAQLAKGAFDTGHPYWGFRFLAWSLHYVQDVTQPWHTVFVPGFSLLSFSRARMKHDISSLHYLTEAFSDRWLLQAVREESAAPQLASQPARNLAGIHQPSEDNKDPWFVSREVERLASSAHERASKIAEISQSFFAPVVERLKDQDLRPDARQIRFGGILFDAEMLDFSGDGSGATAFLSPVWSTAFGLKDERDILLKEVVDQLHAAIDGSRLVITHVLNSGPIQRTQPI